MGVKPGFLFSLGGYSKQAGEKRHLPQDVSFVSPLHLPFPHHVHPDFFCVFLPLSAQGQGKGRGPTKRTLPGAWQRAAAKLLAE
jgi:hypothetical protein